MNTKSLPCLTCKLAAALWLMTISAAPAQTGVPLRTNRYNGPANGDDVARAVVVDRSSNVIVAGHTDDFVGAPSEQIS